MAFAMRGVAASRAAALSETSSRPIRTDNKATRSHNELSSRARVVIARPRRQPPLQIRRLVVESRVAMRKRCKDYSGNANDRMILRLNPHSELNRQEIANAFGYPRNLSDRYDIDEQIGSGTYGTVYKAIDKVSGCTYACKTIPKTPKRDAFSNPHHLLKIRSEVDCMTALGSSLDAVFLRAVYEDDTSIHLIMELCEGGTLMDSMEVAGMTEHNVAFIMRSILRFLAQSHSKGLVYRDVKPENFLFSNNTFDRTLKATDFGLMTQLLPGDPRIQNAAGTPIYLAPEVVHRSYGQEADVYSAGVIAFQMLTGRFPYWPSNKFKTPTMTQLFEIITDYDIDFSQLRSEGVSELAEDFLQSLLKKDPKERLTAHQALEHPWIREDNPDLDRPLSGTVVQRLQRFAVNGRLKKSIMNMMTEDIINGKNGIFDTLESSTILAPFEEIFQRVDTDNSGDVSADELMAELMLEGYLVSDAEAAQLVDRLDANGDGKVAFDEFTSSLLDLNEINANRQWRQLARRAFDRLDVDNNGTIDLEDVFPLLQNSQLNSSEKEEEARAMIREFDTDGDGHIDWEEFIHRLTEGSTPESLEFYDRRLSGSSWDSSSTSLSSFTQSTSSSSSM